MGFIIFHLGDQYIQSGKSKGFIQRTGPVAIAYVTDSAIYMLDIRTHGHGCNDLWVDDSTLIEIIHQNWPILIKQFKVNTILVSPSPTMGRRSSRKQLQYNNNCGDNNYMPIGGEVSIADNIIKIANSLALCKRITRQINLIINYIFRKNFQSIPHKFQSY